MGRIAVVLVVALSLVTMPLLSAQAASTNNAPALKRVDGLLDRSLRELRAAERFADQKHLGRIDRTTDQGMKVARSADGATGRGETPDQGPARAARARRHASAARTASGRGHPR